MKPLPPPTITARLYAPLMVFLAAMRLLATAPIIHGCGRPCKGSRLDARPSGNLAVVHRVHVTRPHHQS
ncbi:hypothetical protein Dimus_010475, partial [Dionaea muscipula]